LDACSGCAGNYENPDLTAPGRETEDPGEGAIREETGFSDGKKRDVENCGFVDIAGGRRSGRKPKKNKG
jgi:hypothetical protein